MVACRPRTRLILAAEVHPAAGSFDHAPPEITTMSFANASPEEAKALLESPEGWICLDVRTVEEFETAHVPGAYNVPVALPDPAGGGMTPNPEFLEVVRRRFSPETRLVVSCAAGGRSAYACELLSTAGYTNLVNMDRGFSGARTPHGDYLPGWQALGYPVETAAPGERTYEGLRA